MKNSKISIEEIEELLKLEVFLDAEALYEKNKENYLNAVKEHNKLIADKAYTNRIKAANDLVLEYIKKITEFEANQCNLYLSIKKKEQLKSRLQR